MLGGVSGTMHALADHLHLLRNCVQSATLKKGLAPAKSSHNL